MNRPLSDVRLAVIMLDGIELHGYTNIVALEITTEGEKLALGLWEGSSENAVAAALLSGRVTRPSSPAPAPFALGRESPFCATGSSPRSRDPRPLPSGNGRGRVGARVGGAV